MLEFTDLHTGRRLPLGGRSDRRTTGSVANMRVLGIVAEYNPFHNGHAYQLRKSRESCGAEAVVAVMSGSFTQRGEPALTDKWSRAEMALRGGCDLVLELPYFCATSSAEGFAGGAIDILHGLGTVTHLGFGSETPDTGTLINYAQILREEPPPFKRELADALSSGLPYGRGVERALSVCMYGEDRPGILSTPNMILAVQYARRLLQLDSPIGMVPIERHAAGYHDPIVPGGIGGIASASGIRTRLKDYGSPDLENIMAYVPGTTLEILRRELREKGNLISWEDMESQLLAILRRGIGIGDVMAGDSEGLIPRLAEAVRTAKGFNDLCSLLKSKRHHMARIQRLLCHSLVGLTPDMAGRIKEGSLWRYARVLGFTKTGRKLLAAAKEAEMLPILDKLDSGTRNLPQWASIQLDARSTDIYTTGYSIPGSRKVGLDFKRPPVII